MSNNTETRPPIGFREYHYLDNKLSGMVVTESAKGSVIVPIVDVRDGEPFRKRARQIEKQANGNVSKFHDNNDRLKFHKRTVI